MKGLLNSILLVERKGLPVEMGKVNFPKECDKTWIKLKQE